MRTNIKGHLMYFNEEIGKKFNKDHEGLGVSVELIVTAINTLIEQQWEATDEKKEDLARFYCCEIAFICISFFSLKGFNLVFSDIQLAANLFSDNETGKQLNLSNDRTLRHYLINGFLESEQIMEEYKKDSLFDHFFDKIEEYKQSKPTQC